MIQITTISWWTLLIGAGLLFIIWLMTTRTRYGRLIINRETPWNTQQWTTILVIIAITMFILVNPVFHLTTTGIFAILYYVLVNRNALGRKRTYIKNGGEKLRSGIDFSSVDIKLVNLACKGREFTSVLEERRTLDSCLFSFLTVASNPFPNVEYIDGIYLVEGELSSNKYYSSLIHYLQKSGFDVEIKNTN